MTQRGVADATGSTQGVFRGYTLSVVRDDRGRDWKTAQPRRALVPQCIRGGGAQAVSAHGSVRLDKSGPIEAPLLNIKCGVAIAE